MARFRVKQINSHGTHMFIPQMWCWWYPFWRSFKRTYTGFDWSDVQASSLQEAKNIIAAYCGKNKVSSVVVYHYG